MPSTTKDPGPIAFTAVIEAADGGGAFITFPHDLKELYGIGNLVPIVATFDGIEYRGSIAKMGPLPLLLVRKDVRKKIRKEPGDAVDVIVTLDTSARTIEVPPDLAEALDRTGVRARFDEMAFSHQREYVEWVTSAKREETRSRRVEKAADMVAGGERLK